MTAKCRTFLPCLLTTSTLAALLLVGCTSNNTPPATGESDSGTVTEAVAETALATESTADSETLLSSEPLPESESEAATESETLPETETETETETEPETLSASVTADKAVYEVDEEIILTASGNPGDTVAFFPAAFDITTQKPIYYATFDGENAIPVGEPISLCDLPGQNRKVKEVAFYYGVLPVGDYRAVVTSPEGEVLAETTLTIRFTKATITTGAELAAKCLDVALNYKTLYVNGCFGAPMTDQNKQRYTQNTAYNRQPERQAIINAASSDTFGFDCVCLIKGLLWGWDGDLGHVYGGAAYQANGVPDITEEAMIERSHDVSTDFTQIEVGEVVWIQGHIGVYIGNGLAVECTPAWEDCVQISACNSVRKGYNRRTWTKHGKLPYLEYTGEYESVR